MRKAVARAALIVAVPALFIGPLAGSAQAASASAPASHVTTASKAHPCDLTPWHPACHWHHHDDGGLIDIDL